MSERARITTDPIDATHVAALVRHAGAGAVATFEGIVRDLNDDKPVVLLEYSAYESMALAELERILTEVETELPGVRAAAWHRIGSLHVGDVAVVCAASAPHRGEAFQAVRAAIDRIKSRVPIWKREHGPDGAYWVGWEDARCGHSHE